MEVLDKETKFAHLGKPGTGFSKGFHRRLEIVSREVELKNKLILDQGCGIGVWMHEFKRYTSPGNIFGFDIDPESVDEFKQNNEKYLLEDRIPIENLKVCKAESLEFKDDSFDIVFSNEVMEHVEDDLHSSIESLRVLKEGGNFIIFTPNRGWPFETHGMFWKEKYIWGNIPFLPWMPLSIRRRFAPHVRNYSNAEITKVICSATYNEFKFEIVHHSHVFPAFDKLERKFGILGRLFKKFFHTIEKTPFHFFGISHFIVAKKVCK